MLRDRFVWDGTLCNKPPRCENGQVLVDGQCQCPEGQALNAAGVCEEKKDNKCDSGLTTGKCYNFITENGVPMGVHNNGNLQATSGSMASRPSKFQLCKDKDCVPGQTINPDDTIFIRDMYGDVPTGANRGKWIDNMPNGDHMKLTADFSAAGKLALTKWPRGKYCLGGIDAGVGPACPAEQISLTMYKQDPDMCTPFSLVEVPCNPKALPNNCIWKSPKDQCCGGKVDCSKAGEGKEEPAEEQPEEPIDPKCGKKGVKDGDIVTVSGVQFQTLCGKVYYRTRDTPGYFQEAPAADAVACRKACADEPSCQAPNWDLVSKRCWLSSQYNDPPQTPSKPGQSYIAFRPVQQRPPTEKPGRPT